MTPEKVKVRRRGWVLLSAIAVCFAALRAVTAQSSSATEKAIRSAFRVDWAMKAIEHVSSGPHRGEVASP